MAVDPIIPAIGHCPLWQGAPPKLNEITMFRVGKSTPVHRQRTTAGMAITARKKKGRTESGAVFALAWCRSTMIGQWLNGTLTDVTTTELRADPSAPREENSFASMTLRSCASAAESG
jgi:hypothetical protein